MATQTRPTRIDESPAKEPDPFYVILDDKIIARIDADCLVCAEKLKRLHWPAAWLAISVIPYDMSECVVELNKKIRKARESASYN